MTDRSHDFSDSDSNYIKCLDFYNFRAGSLLTYGVSNVTSFLFSSKIILMLKTVGPDSLTSDPYGPTIFAKTSFMETGMW